MENKEFNSLKEVVRKLRDPKEGCPWDLKQTHLTLLPYLIEESFEFINAAETENKTHMKEELGDIFICREVALRQAKEFGISIEEEILHLFIHGFLHLCGYDHEISREEEKLMFGLEEKLLEKISKKLKKSK